jgi:hypothetical protein
MTSLLTSLALLVIVVGPLVGFAFWKDRRRRAELDENEEMA